MYVIHFLLRCLPRNKKHFVSLKFRRVTQLRLYCTSVQRAFRHEHELLHGIKIGTGCLMEWDFKWNIISNGKEFPIEWNIILNEM